MNRCLHMIMSYWLGKPYNVTKNRKQGGIIDNYEDKGIKTGIIEKLIVTPTMTKT